MLKFHDLAIIESQSFSVMKLNKKRALAIIEMEIRLVSFHFVEYHFLTMSTVGHKEIDFPIRHRVNLEEIKSTTELGKMI